MKQILKMAINSNTVRLVYQGAKVVDYHVADGNSSGLLLDFMKGKSISLEQYESKVVIDLDEFTWKSSLDDTRPIKYVNRPQIQLTHVKHKNEDIVSYYHNRQVTYPRPQPSRIDANNKTNFGNLFGGND